MPPSSTPGRLGRPRRLGRRSAARVLAAIVVAAVIAVACGDGPPTVSPGGTPSPSVAGRPGPSSTPSRSPSASSSAAATTSPSPSSGAGVAQTPCPGKAGAARRGAVTVGQSRNWAGYIIGTSRTHVTCVEGTWVQPTVKCRSTGTSSAAFWVGIDGTSAAPGIPNASATLAQVGTAANCANGQVQLFTWYEFLPDLQQEVPMTVPLAAGDHIWAQVRWLGGSKFRATLVNITQGSGATQDWTLRGAPRLTAEWVAEAPATPCSTGSCPVMPLAPFGSVAFNGYATIGGARYRLATAPYAYLRLSIVRGKRTLATTSSLGSRGFTVTWKAS